ncbi:hypothetical protein [Microseira wollei]|uniref:Transposase n=1 Tax=Microseira wollei NIES-4236 TaxID=2530354 RepID=A0AAV3XLM2_9CYAN|nr:hypothetical protein [Microseira wollei]GET41940.1 hypothetical protein MiSe_67540 [Microseira wollei NIES-4236]
MSDSHYQKRSQIVTGQYTEHLHVRTRVAAICRDRRKILDLLNFQGAEVLILFASASQIGIIDDYFDDFANRVNCQAVQERFSRRLESDRISYSAAAKTCEALSSQFGKVGETIDLWQKHRACQGINSQILQLMFVKIQILHQSHSPPGNTADCLLSEVHLCLCSGTLKGAATQTKRFRCTSRGCKPL